MWRLKAVSKTKIEILREWGAVTDEEWSDPFFRERMYAAILLSIT